MSAGARYVEFDVQFSSDGVPVLLHDATLHRTAGVARAVFECPVAELSATPLDNDRPYGGRVAEVILPTLHQAVDVLNRTPHVTAFVELKRHSVEHFGVARVVAGLLQVMSDARFDWVMISFVAEAVSHLQASAGRAGGWILRRYDSPTWQSAQALAPAYLIIKAHNLPAGPGRLWPGPWRWMVYDIDDAASALRCREMGASFIETNRLQPMLARFPVDGS